VAETRELIERYALQNAVKYQAAPNQGAVMGKLMGEHPELRSQAKEIAPLIKEVLAEVEKTSPEEWQRRLEAVAPELLEELSVRREPQKGLSPLEGAENGVVMRFAPNPNGPPTLGSARGIIINSEYVKRYGGKFIIRFDDTDPAKKRPMIEAYGWYLEDCAWLGAVPDQVIKASERLPLYYPVAEELIQRDGAYVCQCPQEVFKEYKERGVACPHRDQTREESLPSGTGRPSE
jgi:glutamyl-tRNA synthetase